MYVWSVSMPARKLRVEVFDDEGNRYIVIVEGEVTRKKAQCVLDIVELLGSVQKGTERMSPSKSTKFSKTKLLINDRFAFSWFSSRDIVETYGKTFGDVIALSTASTYLARMTRRGFLMTEGPQNNRKYRMFTELSKSTLKSLNKTSK